MDVSIAVFLVGGLVVVGVGAYFYLMIFHPEWVGITGKVAMKNLAEHQDVGNNPNENSDPGAKPE